MEQNERITEHVKFKELLRSHTALAKGIKNIPNEEEIENLRNTCTMIFEPIRALLGGHPIIISSAFRCKALNKAIGGSETSQHMEGMALDLVAVECSNVEMFEIIKECSFLDFDQLILEGYKKDKTAGWVHISTRPDGKNRNEALIMVKGKEGNKKITKYLTYEQYLELKK